VLRHDPRRAAEQSQQPSSDILSEDVCQGGISFKAETDKTWCGIKKVDTSNSRKRSTIRRERKVFKNGAGTEEI
jgi:hypothetical protein